ncbi:hypothetical protein [Herbaspirillum sp. C9C3]|uniref:hypothetical protein n=1 Tax=Herbaspirillum sp. C9C3 TaxID=2735271 RepID=UPI0015859167|nr:hypothetical protein [Herbaspirillum sp. C9C3]NUT62611.1 hypothetical protein [Herbaspirillum sp. C9C3]
MSRLSGFAARGFGDIVQLLPRDLLIFSSALAAPRACFPRRPGRGVNAPSVASRFSSFACCQVIKTHQMCVKHCRKAASHAAFSSDKKTFDCHASWCYRVGAFAGMTSRGKT